jgi:hypothetical protein
LHPIKPRVLFSAMGEKHAEQIARIATEYGIPTSHLHHSMTETRIRAIRDRFEQAAGDLQGIVQLKMLILQRELSHLGFLLFRFSNLRVRLR